MIRLKGFLALALLIAATCMGCGGGQDPDQPAIGSITVEANKDDEAPLPKRSAKSPSALPAPK